MFNSFQPQSEIKPLNRVAVKDGLLLTAELWQQAHDYHRRKQDLFYQSFHSPGIVAGLGISVIKAPMDIPAQYRDHRWLRIKPGFAIDGVGNAIIVPQGLDFRIASTAKEKPLTIYVVISYVDPDNLANNSHPEIITETFRIDEKINPPHSLEIELCRILLQPDDDHDDFTEDGLTLTNAIDVFNPQPNSLDLRYRCQATIRAQKIVKVGQVVKDNPRSKETAHGFTSLMRSLAGMYPQMSGDLEILPINLQPRDSEETDSWPLVEQNNLSLIYLDYEQVQKLSQQEIKSLKPWSQNGTIILIQYNTTNTDLARLKVTQQQIRQVIDELESKADTLEEAIMMRRQFKNELKSLQDLIGQETGKIIAGCQPISKMLGIDLTASGIISPDHPIRNSPFLFASFPLINLQLIDIFNWQNLVLVIGNLTDSWKLDRNSVRQREEIRTCQEMGINLLHFDWQWSHLQRLSSNPSS